MKASDTGGQDAVAGIRITVAAAPLEIVTPELPSALVQRPYPFMLQATGGTPPYLWRIVDGALPQGLHLDAGSGEIAGQAEVPGVTLLTVEATDAGGLKAGRPFELLVADRAPAVPGLGRYGGSLLIFALAIAGLLLLHRAGEAG